VFMILPYPYSLIWFQAALATVNAPFK